MWQGRVLRNFKIYIFISALQFSYGNFNHITSMRCKEHVSWYGDILAKRSHNHTTYNQKDAFNEIQKVYIFQCDLHFVNECWGGWRMCALQSTLILVDPLNNSCGMPELLCMHIAHMRRYNSIKMHFEIVLFVYNEHVFEYKIFNVCSSLSICVCI